MEEVQITEDLKQLMEALDYGARNSPLISAMEETTLSYSMFQYRVLLECLSMPKELTMLISTCTTMYLEDPVTLPCYIW